MGGTVRVHGTEKYIEVKQATNIVGLFQTSGYDDTGKYCSPDKIQLRVLDSSGVQIGEDVTMEVLDSCDDCSDAAAPSGNLVNMEINTLINVYGSTERVNVWKEGGLEQICYKIGPASGPAPVPTDTPSPAPVVFPAPVPDASLGSGMHQEARFSVVMKLLSVGE